MDAGRSVISDEIRAACAWVAERAQSVWIEKGAIAEYARALPAPGEIGIVDPRTQLLDGDRESRAAFVICLNAINFGSGWWPTIRKRPGLSGYSTVAASLVECFRSEGPWGAAQLVELTAAEVAGVLGQDPDHPLMEDFARSLRDVGAHLLSEHGARFEPLIDTAQGSALELAGLLATWEAFADSSFYLERPVPLYKRAQLTAADLDRAGIADFPDRDRLTAFADNLVPHVLRIDGVLQLDPELERRIEAGELLEHGSPEEVELRACSVHAVELLTMARDDSPSPPEIDAILWNRGRDPRYKEVPRPRSRNTAY